jgi:hypothetical protein
LSNGFSARRTGRNVEACEHSEAYKHKVQLERASNNVSPASERKRPVETNSAPASPIRKHASKRVSSVYQRPLTDEELAMRLKEVRILFVRIESRLIEYFPLNVKQNQEEHRHRWARGTFLDVLRSHLRHVSKSSPMLPSSPLPSEWTPSAVSNMNIDEKSLVTISMLRAPTKSVKDKYQR